MMSFMRYVQGRPQRRGKDSESINSCQFNMTFMENTGLNTNTVHRSYEAAEVIMFLLHDFSAGHTTRCAFCSTHGLPTRAAAP
jgi:hypothetical protein